MTAISEILHQGSSIIKASKALILLHGRGGTARSILGLANRICDDNFYVTAPQAMHNTWYPYSFMEEEERNEPYLSLSVKKVKDLIDQISKYIPKQRIFIAGFSQGACLALEVGTRFAVQYGGIIAFTGGLIGKTVDESKYYGNFVGTKVFISDGDNDPHVPLIRAVQSKELMEKLGANVTLKVYEGRPHIILEDEIVTVKENILGS